MNRPAQTTNTLGRHIRDIILGGQDGLVNVLGVALGVAAASNSPRLVLAAGLAAAFAESFSMAAVAYTASEAERDYRRASRRAPQINQTNQVDGEPASPAQSALVVGVAAIIGSIIPLLPFVWLAISLAIPTAIVLSAIALFLLGAMKARVTIGSWQKSGLEIVVIGLLAALVGYLVGLVFKM